MTRAFLTIRRLHSLKSGDTLVELLSLYLRARRMMATAVAVRAQGDGVIDRIWSAVGQKDDVMNFKEEIAVTVCKWPRLFAAFADSISLLEHVRNDPRIATVPFSR